MIVIGIIGIVAESTIPSLVSNVMTRVYVQSASSVLIKIEEATKQMNTASLLSGYATNEAFVDAFQKYVKTNKRCTSTELTKCFAPSFKTGMNETIDTSDLKTGTNFSLAGNSNPLVGLQFADGSSAIMAYKSDCNPPKWYDTRAGSYSANSIYAPGSSTACLSMVYDTNGFKGPNKIGKDVYTFNATLSTCDGTKIGAICVAPTDILFATYGSLNTCNGSADLSYDPYGSTNPFCAYNAWAGAKKYCQAQGKRLPTGDELKSMYQNYLTGGNTVGFSVVDYWASTDYAPDAADILHSTGKIYGSSKNSWRRVRCVN